MNELIKAILDVDQDKLIELIGEKPELVNCLSESGRTPLQVAKATENPFMYVTLIRYELPGHGKENNWGDLLLEYIGQISNDWFMASWKEGIEFEVWKSINGGGFYEYLDDEVYDLSKEMKNDLLFLSKKSCKWVCYEAPEGLISLEEWGKIYNAWKENG